MNRKPCTIFIFAHQDDEYMVSERIRHDVQSGKAVYCVYLTNGIVTDAAAPIARDEESRAVLRDLGVIDRRIAFIGSEFAIPDGGLWNVLEDALKRLCWKAADWDCDVVERVYTMAWEGGHADHDAAHIVALAFAKQIGALDRVWSFPSYNARGVPKPLFRVMSPLERTPRDDIRELTPKEALRGAFVCWRYPSQRKTWIGLFPEAFVKIALLRRDLVQPVDRRRAEQRPHAGDLLYERMNRERYERIAPICAAFLERHVNNA